MEYAGDYSGNAHQCLNENDKNIRRKIIRRNK